ncbi:uncharacterized protein LOC108237695 isoform X2 [Kryptolebias marmoratus]|uniref:uncharacterized protein LOC108237695 isoform X2 n=1 Tax=Kryptolebias marmoratus TaxID=37003 RepID=UPI0007F8FD3A|nr:uncharacterized protein LOC108237695 isoform X2 [Kryptolebias marmoratus]
MPRGKEIPEGIRAQIVELHNAGKSYRKISKDLEIHSSTVKDIIKKWKRFRTVATLPRSGRPTKDNPKRKRRKVPEDDHAGPADDRGRDQDDEERRHNIIPDAAENPAGCYSSDTKTLDEDLIMCEVDHEAPESTQLTGEDPNQKMRVYSNKAEDVEDKEHSSDTDDEDSVRRNLTSASCDEETTAETPLEQVCDPKLDGERLIFPGSSVTVGSLLLLLLTFILKHDLSKAATKDLLDLLSLVVPGCIPSSLQLLKKHLTDCDNKPEIHFYCSKCANYLGVEPGAECGVCQQGLSQKSLLEKAYYFLVMPLESQLRNILARVHSKLGEHLTKDASISDVNTGGEYKHKRQEGSVTLTFKCDSSPLLSSSKLSVWPILCTINELPFVERCQNVLLHTLWFGREKPPVQCFFTPFINELHKLSHEGLIWRDGTGLEVSTRVTAEICVCDSTIRSMLQNFQPFEAEFGCGFCYHKGELVQKGRAFSRVYPIQADVCDLRHMAETEQLAELVIENDYPQGQMGVKGQSPLLLLPSFDIIKGFIPDYMHCFCLGVVPEFVNLWFDPLYARKRFHLTLQHSIDLDEALCAVRPPDEIGRSPRSLSERTRWEASEWRAFALLYSPVVLKNVLPALFYKHWMLLICAFHVLLSQFATQEELSCAQLCLVQFVAQVPSLYGLEHCSFNCHLLTHLPESARDRGLPWANSSFVFQHVNSRLLQMYSSSKSAASQMCQNFCLYQEVLKKGKDVLQDAGAEIKDFFCSMTSCETLNKPLEYVGEHVITLGCGSLRSPTMREMAAMQKKDRSQVREFKGFLYKNMLVTSSEHSITCKRNNSVIETSSGFAVVESVVVVETLCSCERESSCSCRELLVFCKKLLRANAQPSVQHPQINRNIAEFLVRVKSSDELCAVTCGDIVAKCFLIEQKAQFYVMRLPVCETH